MFSLASGLFIKSTHLVPWFIAFLVSNIKSILPWYSNLKLIRQIIRIRTNNFLSSKHNKWYFSWLFLGPIVPQHSKFWSCVPLKAAVEDNFIPNIRIVWVPSSLNVQLKFNMNWGYENLNCKYDKEHMEWEYVDYVLTLLSVGTIHIRILCRINMNIIIMRICGVNLTYT